MNLIFSFIGIFIGLAVLAAFIAGFFIWIGAKLACIKDATLELRAIGSPIKRPPVKGKSDPYRES